MKRDIARSKINKIIITNFKKMKLLDGTIEIIMFLNKVYEKRSDMKMYSLILKMIYLVAKKKSVNYDQSKLFLIFLAQTKYNISPDIYQKYGFLMEKVDRIIEDNQLMFNNINFYNCISKYIITNFSFDSDEESLASVISSFDNLSSLVINSKRIKTSELSDFTFQDEYYYERIDETKNWLKTYSSFIDSIKKIFPLDFNEVILESLRILDKDIRLISF